MNTGCDIYLYLMKRVLGVGEEVSLTSWSLLPGKVQESWNGLVDADVESHYTTRLHLDQPYDYDDYTYTKNVFGDTMSAYGCDATAADTLWDSLPKLDQRLLITMLCGRE